MNRLYALFWGVLSCFYLIAAARVGPESAGQQRFEFQHRQMGTTFRVVFYSTCDSGAAVALSKMVFDRIDSLNAVFSDWIPESELSRLGHASGSGEKVVVSPELFDILEKSKRFSRQTQGAFDVTVGPLSRLWRRSRTLKELPENLRVKEALGKTGWKYLELYRKTRSVRLRNKGMALDLGGIAQGWAADDALHFLQKHGVPIALVDAGGDIALGAPPPGQPGWQIDVPASDGGVRPLFLHHCGITTSGATYRFLELDGKRYSHIIDPRTGMALTHRTLVTVQAPDATTADAWATAVSVLGEKGEKIAAKSGLNLKIWLTTLPL